jgi:DNA-binding SARP family transcriptional activator
VRGELLVTQSGFARREHYRRLARRPAHVRRVTHTRSNGRLTSAEPTSTQVPVVSSMAEPIWPAAACRIQIRCFGRFEVFCDGVAVRQWRRHAARTLLKYLVVHRGPVHRDVLLDLLWPDMPASSSLNRLRVTLHTLRQALLPTPDGHDPADDIVLNVGPTYVLNPAALIWVDADAFSAHFEAGLRLERQGRMDAAGREYAAAEALYRDDFLLEDLYEDWTVLRREELTDQYLLLLNKLGQYCLRTDDIEGCIARCHKLLAKEPCSEEAYQRLIRCYLQLGQHRRAARWYDICERTLRQELDVSPSEETQRLHRDIAAQERP